MSEPRRWLLAFPRLTHSNWGSYYPSTVVLPAAPTGNGIKCSQRDLNAELIDLLVDPAQLRTSENGDCQLGNCGDESRELLGATYSFRSTSAELLSHGFPWSSAEIVTGRVDKKFEPRFQPLFINSTAPELIRDRMGFAASKFTRACIQLTNAADTDNSFGIRIDCYQRTCKPHIAANFYGTNAHGHEILSDKYFSALNMIPNECRVFVLVQLNTGTVLTFYDVRWRNSTRSKELSRCIIYIQSTKFLDTRKKTSYLQQNAGIG